MARQRPTSLFDAPWHAATAAGLLVLAVAASAGPLADPTRPPSAQGPAGGPRTASGARPVAAPPAPVVVAPLPLPLLQSVHIPAPGPTQGLALALIDGQPVRTGDTVAGRLVLSIDHQGLVLRGAVGQERLWLLGGSPKQAAGSILTTRSAHYTPAPVEGVIATDAAADPETATNTERSARSPQASALPARPATTGPLSLAGKNAP